jgi:hypothetical protein
MQRGVYHARRVVACMHGKGMLILLVGGLLAVVGTISQPPSLERRLSHAVRLIGCMQLTWGGHRVPRTTTGVGSER